MASEFITRPELNPNCPDCPFRDRCLGYKAVTAMQSVFANPKQPINNVALHEMNVMPPDDIPDPSLEGLLGAFQTIMDNCQAREVPCAHDPRVVYMDTKPWVGEELIIEKKNESGDFEPITDWIAVPKPDPGEKRPTVYEILRANELLPGDYDTKTNKGHYRISTQPIESPTTPVDTYPTGYPFYSSRKRNLAATVLRTAHTLNMGDPSIEGVRLPLIADSHVGLLRYSVLLQHDPEIAMKLGMPDTTLKKLYKQAITHFRKQNVFSDKSAFMNTQLLLGYLADPNAGNLGILTGDSKRIEELVDTICTHTTSEHSDTTSRTEQAEHLTRWAEFIGTSDYPEWFKLYLWVGITGMDKRLPLSEPAISYVYNVLTNTDSPVFRHLHSDKPPTKSGSRQIRSALHELYGERFMGLYPEALEQFEQYLPETLTAPSGEWLKIPISELPTALSGLHLENGLPVTADNLSKWYGVDDTVPQHFISVPTHARILMSSSGARVLIAYDPNGRFNNIFISVLHQEPTTTGEGQQFVLDNPTLVSVVDQLAGTPRGDQYLSNITPNIQDMLRLNDLMQKMTDDPDCRIGNDIPFLYEFSRRMNLALDDAVFCPPWQQDVISGLRQERGDRDVPVIREWCMQELERQAHAAHSAYFDMMGSIERPVMSFEEFKLALKRQQEKWQNDDVFSFMAQQIVANGGRYQLVAAPSVPLDGSSIAKIILGLQTYSEYDQKFVGKLKPYFDSLAHDFVKGSEDVKFILVPTHHDESFTPNTTTEEFDAKISVLSEQYGFLGLADILEATAYQYALTKQIVMRRATYDTYVDRFLVIAALNNNFFDTATTTHLTHARDVKGKRVSLATSLFDNDGRVRYSDEDQYKGIFEHRPDMLGFPRIIIR